MILLPDHRQRAMRRWRKCNDIERQYGLPFADVFCILYEVCGFAEAARYLGMPRWELTAYVDRLCITRRRIAVPPGGVLRVRQRDGSYRHIHRNKAI